MPGACKLILRENLRGECMDHYAGNGKGELINITPSLIKQEIKDYYVDVERYLRWHGIYLTNDRRIPRSQVKKAIQLLKKRLRSKTMDIDELAALVL
jgi:hypothetical protein